MMEGSDVLEAQTLLSNKGFNPGPLDGIFGPKTKAAVEAFQAANAIPASGMVDSVTWAKLRRVPSTYTVVRGDTLVGIGRKTGIDWHVIADLNGLTWPYTIYPGQVLKLSS
jgi:g-D-glutamyl-meso-diaminopimelate peptidase